MRIRLFRYLLLGSLTICLATSLYGQNSSKVKKAISAFNGGKIDKGIGLMEIALRKDPSDENWEILVSMYLERYNIACELYDEREAAIEEKKRIPKAYTHPDECFDDLVKTCREAGLNAWCPSAAQLLRQFFIDPPVDTLISEPALEAMNKAEDHFAEEDYEKAIKKYKKALEINPGYYAANLYMGQAWWYLENYDSAVFYFQEARNLAPGLLEPHIYQVQALTEGKSTTTGNIQCWDALMLYPDPILFQSYEELVEQEGQKIDFHWIPRGSEVNTIGETQNRAIDQVWSIYRKSKEEIAPYCNEQGIIVKENDLTESAYMEVYCWEKMLTETKELPKDLRFAKKMHKAGKLEYYVLFCLFHFDLYDQYQHLVSEKRQDIYIFTKDYLIR